MHACIDRPAVVGGSMPPLGSFINSSSKRRVQGVAHCASPAAAAPRRRRLLTANCCCCFFLLVIFLLPLLLLHLLLSWLCGRHCR